MSQIGCPTPTLQRAYFDDDGFIGECDFSWPELAAIGEADGKNKYLDFSKRSGKSIEQVLIDNDRDNWFDAKGALEYGFVDHIRESAADVIGGGGTK